MALVAYRHLLRSARIAFQGKLPKLAATSGIKANSEQMTYGSYMQLNSKLEMLSDQTPLLPRMTQQLHQP
jgi:hypothetical protein